jgi:hypothetical protein
MRAFYVANPRIVQTASGQLGLPGKSRRCLENRRGKKATGCLANWRFAICPRVSLCHGRRTSGCSR